MFDWKKCYLKIKRATMHYLAHFGGGALLAWIIFYTFYKILGLSLTSLIAFICSFAFGVLIEYLDYKAKDSWDIFDVISTLLGGIMILNVIQISNGLL